MHFSEQTQGEVEYSPWPDRNSEIKNRKCIPALNWIEYSDCSVLFVSNYESNTLNKMECLSRCATIRDTLIIALRDHFNILPCPRKSAYACSMVTRRTSTCISQFQPQSPRSSSRPQYWYQKQPERNVRSRYKRLRIHNASVSQAPE